MQGQCPQLLPTHGKVDLLIDRRNNEDMLWKRPHSACGNCATIASFRLLRFLCAACSPHSSSPSLPVSLLSRLSPSLLPSITLGVLLYLHSSTAERPSSSLPMRLHLDFDPYRQGRRLLLPRLAGTNPAQRSSLEAPAANNGGYREILFPPTRNLRLEKVHRHQAGRRDARGPRNAPASTRSPPCMTELPAELDRITVGDPTHNLNPTAARLYAAPGRAAQPPLSTSSPQASAATCHRLKMSALLVMRSSV